MRKRPKPVQEKKKKFGLKYKLFKMSYLDFCFWKYYFGHTMYLYLSRRSSWHHHSFFNFKFSSRKSLSQQKLAKKIAHFTIQFRSKNLTHLTNLNSLDIENKIQPQRSQKTFWLYKFSTKHVSVWCQKQYLHCTIFWCPRPAVLKHLEGKCLYISTYLFTKIFVPET